MLNIVIVPMFLVALISSTKFDEDQELVDQLDAIVNISIYDRESKQGNAKTLEKEKESKLIRKSKRQNKYRRAPASVVKSSEGYTKLFEDLIQNSTGKPPLSLEKETDDVVVSETLINSDINEYTDASPIKELETDNDHISDSDNMNDTDNKSNESSILSDFFNLDENTADPIKKIPILLEAATVQSADATTNDDLIVNTKGRMGINESHSIEVEPMVSSSQEENTLSDLYSLDRISNVGIPQYRTALSRSVLTNPAMYTVPTSSPNIDYITSLKPHRTPDLDSMKRSGSKGDLLEPSVKLIEDYVDYNTNTYLYSPRSYEMVQESRQKNFILSKLGDAPPQPSIDNRVVFKNMYASYYPQMRRAPVTFRSFYRLHR